MKKIDKVWCVWLYPLGSEAKEYLASGLSQKGSDLILADVRYLKMRPGPEKTPAGMVKEGAVVVHGIPYLYRQIDKPEWWEGLKPK